jgi:O-antigen/teichoic acid export membrane protein
LSPSQPSLSRNALANILQMLVGAALLFVLYRFLNGTLGVAGLGVWSVVLSTASASRFADLGLSQGVTRFVAKNQANQDSLSSVAVIETAMVSLMIIGIILVFVLYVPLTKLLPLFFRGEQLQSALELIPYALASLWLTLVSTVVQSGFDGCQRMDLRASLVVVGQVLLLLFSFWLVPEYGLTGYAWAQIIQGIFQLVAGWVFLRRTFQELSWIPIRWSLDVFREMFSYGINMQAASLFMLFFDPLTKALMVKFGSASAAGYFEMANQVVIKARSLIVAANQAIVPKVSHLAETAPNKLKGFYIDNLRLIIFIALPAFSLIIVWAGFIAKLLTGGQDPLLLLLIRLSAVGWLLNTMSAPAYFSNMGTGRLGLNTLSSVMNSSVNAGFGFILGYWIGAEGVAIAYAIALAIGSGVLILAFQKGAGIELRDLRLREHAFLALVSGLIILYGFLQQSVIVPGNYSSLLTNYILVPCIMILALWRNVMFSEFVHAMRNI